MTDDETTVVIADDDGDIRSLVAIAVRRAGFTLVSEHADGASALESITSNRPDLVVLDVSMPGLTGLEIARAMRADDALTSTRIVVLSAGVDPGSHARGIDAGADHYLTKPFSPGALAARLKEIME